MILFHKKKLQMKKVERYVHSLCRFPQNFLEENSFHFEKYKTQCSSYNYTIEFVLLAYMSKPQWKISNSIQGIWNISVSV